jgi:5,10-methylenetetrahydromethanopterin reductase
MSAFDVSVGISPRQSLESWAAFVAALEAEGVRRIWVIDSQLAMKDVYAGLTVAALNTRRVGLGTGVTNAVTRHPTVTANAIAAIAEISRGRALLGLGAGDSALYGVGLKPQKVAEMEEAITFFRAVLGGGEGRLGGRRYRLPHVAGSVPVYLAVSQERMCDLAGRLADGAIVMGPAQPDMVRRQVEWIENGLKDANRSRSELEIAFMATISTELDDVRSWASTQARLLGRYRELPGSLLGFGHEFARSAESYDYAEHLSTNAAHGAAVSDDLVRALAIVGTPDECAARLRDLQATGIDSLIFPLAGRGRLERWRKVRDEILGQLMV